jgi:ADP-heptose:LPS heptosyltransferase
LTKNMVPSLGKIHRYFHYFCRHLIDRAAVIGAGAKNADVLLLVRPDGIGDFVVWLDSARILRDHYSEKKIVLLANQIFAELAEKLEYFDEVIAVDVKKFERDLGYRFKIVRQIRSLYAEIAIQPIYSRQFWVGDAMIRASGASQRIGSEGDRNYLQPWQRRMASHWYTQFVPASGEKLTELERNIEFLQGMGLGEDVPRIATISVVTELPPNLQIKDDYFIVFPGAGSSKRIWSPRNYAEAARAIAEKTSWHMVICGSSAEVELADTLIEAAALEGSQTLAGRTSVPELVELIRGARMLIGSETSAVHIAAAVSTPSVCLLGGGHFGRFVPYPASVGGVVPIPVFHKMKCYGCSWQCTQFHEVGQAVPCISAISVEKVVAAVEVILSARQVDVTAPR